MSTNTTTQNGTPDPWQEKELGVFWRRKKQGTNESYLTGNINLKALGFDKDVQVIVFTNKRKQKETHPDLRMYVSEKRQASAAPAAGRAPAARTAPAAAPKAAPAPATVPAADDNSLI
jgi:hypothetical protein